MEKIRELALEVFHYAGVIQQRHDKAHAIARAGEHWLNEDADETAKNLFAAIVAEVETNECELLVEKAESLRQLLAE